MNIPEEALAGAKARRDAMIAAVRSGDLEGLARLSYSGHEYTFEPGGRYRLATLGSEGAELLKLDFTGNVEAALAAYIAMLEALEVREFVGIYHGRIPFGVGWTDLFHIVEGGLAGQNAAINPGDVLAIERLDVVA